MRTTSRSDWTEAAAREPAGTAVSSTGRAGREKDRAPGRRRVPAMMPSPPGPSLPARLWESHWRLPLAGDPPNALLTLPDDRIL